MQAFRVLIVIIVASSRVIAANSSVKLVDEMTADFDEIDELLVDVLNPDWTLQLKEVDPTSGMVTMTVVIGDGTRLVTKVKNNWRGCCVIDGEWKDWRKKTKQTDPRTERITETAFLVDGIEKISETHPKTRASRERILYADGTTKIWDQRPDWTRVGLENVTTIHPDGAKEFREIDPKAEHLIITTFFPNGTLKSKEITSIDSNATNTIPQIIEWSLPGVTRNCEPGFAPDVRGRCRRNEDLD